MKKGVTIPPRKPRTRVNNAIRIPELRLIDQDGNQLGIVSNAEAKSLAKQAGLDLVEISPNAKPPVAKIMDYGKYAYEKSIKERETRRKQVVSELKEVRFRLKIEKNDLDTKISRAIKFLENGDRVKISVQMRGREQARPEIAVDLLANVAEEISDYGFVEDNPKKEGRSFSLIVVPNKKKTTQPKEEKVNIYRQKKEERKERQEARLQKKLEAEKKAASGETAEEKVAEKEQHRKVFEFDADQI